MKCRLAAAGWENFTGFYGFQVEFKDGVSVNELTPRQIARVGATTRLVNAETGEQVGPATAALMLHSQSIPVATPVVTQVQTAAQEEIDREKLAAEAAARKAEEKAAFDAAKAKADELDEDLIVYSRQELEAIGANDGIAGLREIATPLGVKGRGITELVTEILAAQAKKVAS